MMENWKRRDLFRPCALAAAAGFTAARMMFVGSCTAAAAGAAALGLASCRSLSILLN